MTLLNAKAASKYILSSILIGVVLGAIGAVVANLFRNGIVFLNEWEVSLFQSLPRFFFYFIALTLSAIIVHFIKKQLNTAAFHGVADSIYFAHKSSDATEITMHRPIICPVRCATTATFQDQHRTAPKQQRSRKKQG